MKNKIILGTMAGWAMHFKFLPKISIVNTILTGTLEQATKKPQARRLRFQSLDSLSLGTFLYIIYFSNISPLLRIEYHTFEHT
jgi:hypothetical protein